MWEEALPVSLWISGIIFVLGPLLLPIPMHSIASVREVLSAVIETPDAAALTLADAEKLTDLPMGLYDCEVDAGGNVLFTMNLWGGTNVLGQWNGTSGAGANYDTLAVSAEWLGMVKSRGDYTAPLPWQQHLHPWLWSGRGRSAYTDYPPG